MRQENKVRLITDNMPKSFNISAEEYSAIYPNDITPRRLPITFHYATKSLWIDKPIADFIVNKYPDIRYYKESDYIADEPVREQLAGIRSRRIPNKIYLSGAEIVEVMPSAQPIERNITFGYGDKPIMIEPELAEYLAEKYNDIYIDSKPLKQKTKRPEVLPDDRWEALLKIGWSQLNKEERDEYRELKKLHGGNDDKARDSS